MAARKPAKKKPVVSKPTTKSQNSLPPVIKFTRHQQVVLRKQREDITTAKLAYADAEIIFRRARAQANERLISLQAEEKALNEAVSDFALKHGIDPTGGVNWAVDLDKMTMTRSK